MTNTNKEQPLVYLARLSTKGGWLLVLTIVLAAVSGVLAVIPLWSLYRLIVLATDNIQNSQQLRHFGILIGAAGIAHLITFMCAMLFSHITAFRILRDLRYALAKKLLELPLGWFTRRSTGDIRKLFTEDVEKFELFIAHHIPDITRGIVIPLATLTLLFCADWKLALLSCVPLVLAPFFLRAVYRNYNRDMKKYYELLTSMNSTIIEYIRGMSLVRAFNRTAASFGTYKESVNSYFTFWKKWTLAVLNTYGGFTTSLESGALWMLAGGGIMFLLGIVSKPSFLLGLIVGPAWVASVRSLFFMMNMMSMNFQGVSRLREVLEAQPLSEPHTAQIPSSMDIHFNSVQFAYDTRTVLNSVSFEAKKGTLTAFVGPSGAGKSTAALLAARFYDPAAGTVTMGNTPYTHIGTRSILDHVSICFQESQLFKGTIEDNIRMGNKKASRSDIIRSAQAAKIHSFIETLPNGYDTQVSGDRVLSGGQIQRLAIARAILKDSPIIILDEATSYADPENERLIQEALNELLADRTVIVVAHRLKTLVHADNIIVFDKGNIVESGTFNNLMAQKGMFSKLWEGGQSAMAWDLASIQAAEAVQ